MRAPQGNRSESCFDKLSMIPRSTSSLSEREFGSFQPRPSWHSCLHRVELAAGSRSKTSEFSRTRFSARLLAHHESSLTQYREVGDHELCGQSSEKEALTAH